MSGSVEGPAFRYGAPAAVVDPLLSFLFDLRRIEASVLSALGHLGVQRQRLPPPFGDSADCGTGRPQSQHGGAEKRERVAAPSTTASSTTSTFPHNAPTTTTTIKDVSAVPVSALDAYVASCLSCSAPPPPAASAAAVEHMLKWLDQQPSATQLPLPSSSTSHSLSPAARSLLVAFVAAAGEGREAVLVDVESGAETVQQKGAAKRRRTETEEEEEETSRTTHSDDARHKVATLSAAEVQTTADQCRRYEKLLRGGARELAATLSAVTTSDLAASYSCHAKWVEVAPEDHRVRCVLPSSGVVRTNYERLIALSDAFATCQAAMHSAYVVLEEAVDTLLEEAVVVDKAERAFQRCVAQAQEECAALHILRRRLKRTRQTLERAAALDA